MSTPAGWYDDGSGRQRWWDGAQWTDSFAPTQSVPAPAQSTPTAYGYPAAPLTTGAPVPPVLGFVGLGLAVVGTIVACIPVVFGLGAVILLAAFVLSLIAIFKKGTAKWPSIVGMILSVVGGFIGTIILVVSLVTNVDSTLGLPTDTPPSTTEQQSDSRPSPEEITEGIASLARADGITDYDDMPDFYPCMAQYLYDSDLSDESLQLLANAQDVTGPEREAVSDTIIEAGLTCDPEGEGLR